VESTGTTACGTIGRPSVFSLVRLPTSQLFFYGMEPRRKKSRRRSTPGKDTRRSAASAEREYQRRRGDVISPFFEAETVSRAWCVWPTAGSKATTGRRRSGKAGDRNVNIDTFRAHRDAGVLALSGRLWGKRVKVSGDMLLHPNA